MQHPFSVGAGPGAPLQGDATCPGAPPPPRDQIVPAPPSAPAICRPGLWAGPAVTAAHVCSFQEALPSPQLPLPTALWGGRLGFPPTETGPATSGRRKEVKPGRWPAARSRRDLKAGPLNPDARAPPSPAKTRPDPLGHSRQARVLWPRNVPPPSRAPTGLPAEATSSGRRKRRFGGKRPGPRPGKKASASQWLGDPQTGVAAGLYTRGRLGTSPHLLLTARGGEVEAEGAAGSAFQAGSPALTSHTRPASTGRPVLPVGGGTACVAGTPGGVCHRCRDEQTCPRGGGASARGPAHLCRGPCRPLTSPGRMLAHRWPAHSQCHDGPPGRRPGRGDGPRLPSGGGEWGRGQPAARPRHACPAPGRRDHSREPPAPRKGIPGLPG